MLDYPAESFHFQAIIIFPWPYVSQIDLHSPSATIHFILTISLLNEFAVSDNGDIGISSENENLDRLYTV